MHLTCKVGQNNGDFHYMESGQLMDSLDYLWSLKAIPCKGELHQETNHLALEGNYNVGIIKNNGHIPCTQNSWLC
jgi:hypothetical protein